MAVTDLSADIAAWYNQTIAGSSLWAGLGFAIAVAVGLLLVVLACVALVRLFAGLMRWVRSLRRADPLGYVIAVAGFSGPDVQASERALADAVKSHFDAFSFGAPFTVLHAPRFTANRKGSVGDQARAWMKSRKADVMLIGGRTQKDSPVEVNVLVRDSARPADPATHSVFELQSDFEVAPQIVHKLTAYLVARALQPGLASGTNFKAEKIEPIARLIWSGLLRKENFTPLMRALLEHDYCAMALHVGETDLLENLVTLRRSRLGTGEFNNPAHETDARVDLGRALLALSERKFDPVRIREAMDHLKAAVELLKTTPTIQLANATSRAVQQGQAMLNARSRFSVTSGGL